MKEDMTQQEYYNLYIHNRDTGGHLIYELNCLDCFNNSHNERNIVIIS